MGNLVYKFIALAIFNFGYAYAIPLEFDSGLGRIANGINATENQFPYAISLQYLSPAEQVLNTRGHRCGGALITFRHALTSASCLHDTVDGESVVIRPNEYRVFAGAVLLTNDTTSSTQPTPDRIRMISNFSIHPNYIGAPAFVNDIAVIILTTPFAVATVRPLSLPAANFNPVDFTLCQVAGWGAPNQTETANTALQFANKYIYNQNLCTLLYNPQPGVPNVLPSMVCAASFDILSTGCVNDEGNALICDGTLTGILVVHDNCRSSSHPELYTRVSNYTTWIRSVSAAPALFTPAVFIMTALFSITQIFSN